MVGINLNSYLAWRPCWLFQVLPSFGRKTMARAVYRPGYLRLEPVNEVRGIELADVQTSVWNVLLQMRKGPRQSQAGELAEAVRQLKSS